MWITTLLALAVAYGVEGYGGDFHHNRGSYGGNDNANRGNYESRHVETAINNDNFGQPNANTGYFRNLEHDRIPTIEPTRSIINSARNEERIEAGNIGHHRHENRQDIARNLGSVETNGKSEGKIQVNPQERISEDQQQEQEQIEFFADDFDVDVDQQDDQSQTAINFEEFENDKQTHRYQGHQNDNEANKNSNYGKSRGNTGNEPQDKAFSASPSNENYRQNSESYGKIETSESHQIPMTRASNAINNGRNIQSDRTRFHHENMQQIITPESSGILGQPIQRNEKVERVSATEIQANNEHEDKSFLYDHIKQGREHIVEGSFANHAHQPHDHNEEIANPNENYNYQPKYGHHQRFHNINEGSPKIYNDIKYLEARLSTIPTPGESIRPGNYQIGVRNEPTTETLNNHKFRQTINSGRGNQGIRDFGNVRTNDDSQLQNYPSNYQYRPRSDGANVDYKSQRSVFSSVENTNHGDHSSRSENNGRDNLDKFYYNGGRMTVVPDKDLSKKALNHVGGKDIIIEEANPLRDVIFQENTGNRYVDNSPSSNYPTPTERSGLSVLYKDRSHAIDGVNDRTNNQRVTPVDTQFYNGDSFPEPIHEYRNRGVNSHTSGPERRDLIDDNDSHGATSLANTRNHPTSPQRYSGVKGGSAYGG